MRLADALLVPARLLGVAIALPVAIVVVPLVELAAEMTGTMRRHGLMRVPFGALMSTGRLGRQSVGRGASIAP